MKITITAKDPDGIANSLDQAAKDSAAAVTGIDNDERKQLVESRREEMEEDVKAWVEYSEYITIEIDTKAKTARVVPVKE